jgi:prepilin-type processing-associated H-X9-DG protein
MGCDLGDGVIWAQANGRLDPNDSTRIIGDDRLVRILDISDGASNTFMVGESLVGKNYQSAWAHTDDSTAACAIDLNARSDGTQYPPGTEYPPWDWANVDGFHSAHPGGAYFLYVDGSVHFISNNIDRRTYRAMATRASGEAILQAP